MKKKVFEEKWLTLELAKELKGRKVTISWVDSMGEKATFVMPEIINELQLAYLTTLSDGTNQLENWKRSKTKEELKKYKEILVISTLDNNGGLFTAYKYSNNDCFTVCDADRDAYIIDVE